MLQKLLPPKHRVIHVIAKSLKANLEGGASLPLVGIREDANRNYFIAVNHVLIKGESKLVDTPDMPLPGTDGRGICYLHTDAALVVYYDKPSQLIAQKVEGV